MMTGCKNQNCSMRRAWLSWLDVGRASGMIRCMPFCTDLCR
jgi:hypothetical protein